MTHPEQASSPARERVLETAEQIFGERGYAGVTMRDIAEALKIRQASLYHHMPGGKEQLFLAVMERTLARHSAGLDAAIASSAELRGQLLAVARYLLGQPPINVSRLFRTDVPALGDDHAPALASRIAHALFKPIERALVAAYERGEIRTVNTFVAAVTYLAAIESLHEVHRYTHVPREALAADLIDVTLDGLRRR
jgi:TetR/AcrR family transcriptional regulator, cholesterol catabolism regulator